MKTKSYLAAMACLVVFGLVVISGCESESTTGPQETAVQASAVQAEAETQQKVTEITAEKMPSAPVTEEPRPQEQKAPTEAQVKVAEPGAALVEMPESSEQIAPSAKPGVAVTVNGIDIMESEVAERIKPQIERLKARSPNSSPKVVEQFEERLQKDTLDRMITEVLLEQKVKQANIVVSEEDVDNYIVEIAGQQGMSLTEFKDMIEKRGQDFEQWKGQVRKGLPYQRLMEAELGPQIEVTEEEASKYYDENQQQFQSPEQVRASHILIKTDVLSEPNSDPNETKAKAKAEELLKQIKQGADFAELAKANSDCPSAKRGGDLGLFARGRMVPAFEKTAFELEIGQVSDIVETQFGYHIIKVTDRKEASAESFEQAKDNIIERLTRTKRREASMQYVESLKEDADIVYPAGR
ncbi:MAG: peptidylprolyl isomerase [Sedimentisphaerales bacterium]|nr:peptidylprolyl isomerase [Sedimentisphaerales bacterium]